MTELRRLAMGVVMLGSALTGPHGAIAAGPDAPATDRELVLGLRVAPPFALKTPDGIWTGISVELWRHLAEQLRLRFRFEETTQEGLLKGLAIALPFGSPLRRRLNIALVDTTRSFWWRELVGRYLGAE